MSIPIAKPGRDGSSRAALTADDTSNASGWRTLLKFNLVMALLYAAGGWLGLQLAVPPGYATVIWPASGLAVAGVMLYGRWLAIGVFLGSFAVNCYVGGAIQASGVNVVAVAIAMAIAAGSTLQAVVAAELARYLFGVPLRLGKIRDIALLAIVSGPLACVIAASVGVATLYTAGAMGGGQIIGNWLTWWIGDTVGVLVFFPLALLNPWRPWTPEWAGRPTAGFSALALACILVPLAATFYSWIITSEIVYDRNRTAFSRLAADSQQALMYRLESYSQSLDGATGLIMSSKKVTLDEWRTYVDTLDIANTLPGINGIGVIEAVRQSELADYPAKVRADGVDMTIKPKGNAFGHFIIKYIEPIEANREAVGLNIGFEKNRYDAAVHARDTGRSTITKRIFLVQDQTRSAGFLLLRPLYQGATLPATLEDRQAKFLGWVYAPFVAPRFMADLTSGQGESFEFSVYDGASDNQNQLIFTSRTGEAGADKPAFRIERTLPVMQQVWTIVWESTPAFEAQVTSYEPVLVLAGGLLLSILFAALVLSFARREDSIRMLVEQKTRELTASEQQTRSIVDTAMVAIILLTEDRKIVSINRAGQTMLGYGADEAIGRQLCDIMGGKDLIEREMTRLLDRNAEAASEPIRITSRNGAPLYLDVQINPWLSPDGEKHLTAIIRNVTSEVRANRELAGLEQRWKNALEGSEIGVFDIDLATQKSIVSVKWKEMAGFDADEEIDAQKEWLARVHPHDLPRVMEADRACLAGETERSSTEFRFHRRDGRWIWLRSDAVVIERADDGTALRLIGTQRDITELKDAEAALKASEERFRMAIENAPVGMAMVTLERKWIKVNAALCKLLGYSEDELLAFDPSMIVAPEDFDDPERHAEKLIAGEIRSYQRELRMRHRNGNYVWVLLSVSLARDPHSSQRYFISMMQDINDQKEMERLKNEFVSTVSHELRTPLTSIRGSLGLVLGAGDEAFSAGTEKLLKIAQSNCERLVLIINDILDLEKVSSGKMRFEMREEGIPDLVEQIVDANGAYAKEYGIELAVTGETPECHVRVDPDRLHQIVANLISNAVKFSPKGATVRLASELRDGAIRISVSDEGPGIPTEFRGKIFTRFSQADGSATRAKGGTGLGLYISKQMVEHMDGRIDFDSVPGEGATFWIELPVLDHDAGNVTDDEAQKRSA